MNDTAQTVAGMLSPQQTLPQYGSREHLSPAPAGVISLK